MRTLRVFACALLLVLLTLGAATALPRYHVYVRQALTQDQVDALQSVASAGTPGAAAASSSLWESNEGVSADELGVVLDHTFVGIDAGAQLGSGGRKRSAATASLSVVVSEVQAVSIPQPVSAAAVASWGLDRVDQRSLPLSSSYTPDRTGSGVVVWVVDTGVDATHSDFGGRASNVYNTYDPPYDCNDHGTHVAGTIAGATYGVARQATIRAVKVLDCSGSGNTYTVALGLQHVLANRAASRNVINMSLGYGVRDYVVEALLQDLFNAGVTLVAAAGNSNGPACNHFPGAHSTVISVAASTTTDFRASFSNYGSCVTLFAPGQSITSARRGGGSLVLSGTSMAAPHVAGAAALVLQPSQHTPSAVLSNLDGRATANLISNANGSPNKLLFVLQDSNPPQPSTTTTSTTTSGSTTTTSGSTTTSTTSGSTTSSAASALPAGVPALLLLSAAAVALFSA
jgi:aqualysin 1